MEMPAGLTEGISLVITEAAFAFSNTQGSDPAWWMLREGHRGKLQSANPKAMRLLRLPFRCKSEGVAIEVLSY